MKRLLAVCLVGITLIACQKELEAPPPTPDDVIGFWEGGYIDVKYGNIEGYFAFDLRADSTATIYIDQKDAGLPASSENADGKVETTFKYSQHTKKLTFVYKYKTKELATSGAVNDAVVQISGTWGESPDTEDRGTYSVTRK